VVGDSDAAAEVLGARARSLRRGPGLVLLEVRERWLGARLEFPPRNGGGYSDVLRKIVAILQGPHLKAGYQITCVELRASITLYVLTEG
jgi:hypothetical protein